MGHIASLVDSLTAPQVVAAVIAAMLAGAAFLWRNARRRRTLRDPEYQNCMRRVSASAHELLALQSKSGMAPEGFFRAYTRVAGDLDQLTRERTRASYEVIRAELPDNGFRSTYRRLDKPLKGLLEHAAVAARADTNAGYGDARLAEVLAGYDGLSHVVAELEWLCARFPRPD